ncbi:transcription repressor NadR [Chryseomicrobium sp. FSL W7-1435]|uniref:transcription repressor NadR n=2 Tax=Chryseomicrobium sp. FSL W7-1435 TaxID=2921704 RepID=UPI00315B3D38
MVMRKKGQERREWILQKLAENGIAVKGAELAEAANVSRQVIVNDINLLKVAGHPIVATSQGYVLFSESTSNKVRERVVCFHLPENTMDELHTIVDCGVVVEDVTIEHPVYGEISAQVMVSNRNEITSFMTQIKENNATLLLEMTDGTHLHWLTADSQDKIDAAKEALRHKGYLIEN